MSPIRVVTHGAGVAALLVLTLAMACARRDAENGAATADSTAGAETSTISRAPIGDGGAPKLRPSDQADSSFARFRRELQLHLRQRDTTYLYSILTPEIKNSFGGDDGIKGFKRLWKMERPESSTVWSTLARALALGGKLERDDSNQRTSFITPYVFAHWPQGIDAFEHVAVTDSGVPVRERPETTAPVIATVSYSILPVEEWTGFDHDGLPRPPSFAKVKLPIGTSGWISASQVYSPVGWRAFFEKRDERWVMTIFVAGD